MDVEIVQRLSEESFRLRMEANDVRSRLGAAAAHVYNPLEYAWSLHAAYIATYGGDAPREALLVGMNPGPWGMIQTGIPFGDPIVVGQWMGLKGEVHSPPTAELHPARPVIGLSSTRREVSGSRLYGLARDAFGGLATFFERFWVVNYCPLGIFDSKGRNLTPAQLSAADRRLLEGPSDRHLRELVAILKPAAVVGVGAYAEERARAALVGYSAHTDLRIGRMLHPSPASPRANAGWAAAALSDLAALDIVP